MSKHIRRILIMLISILVLAGMTSISNAASDIVVALDPGHGGTESGAVGGNLVEKNLTWKLATRVKEILDSAPGITGVLTKNENDTMNRYNRALNAKNNNADLLVSFHINSNESSNSLSGAEVYITWNTKQRRYYEYSNILGLDILENLRNVGVPSFSPRPRTRVGSPDDVYADGTIADYYGIISWPMHMDIPAVLIEHAFINNPYDRANYLNDTMLNRMAEADAQAIIDNKELFRRTYVGDISTDVQEFNFYKDENERSYVSGDIYVSEWIDGVTWSVPREIPKIRLKAIDGDESCELSVNVIDGNKYHFEGCIEGINPKKQYRIEVESGSSFNISQYRKVGAAYNTNKTLGQYRRDILEIKDNILIFTPTNYYGDIAIDIIDTQLNKNNNGRYISGEIYVSEWIGKLWTEPDINPQIKLVSTDGSIEQELNVSQEEGNKYYFEGYINDIDFTKEYEIKVKLMNTYNLSTQQEATVTYKSNFELGKYGDYDVKIQDNKITFKEIDPYQGDLSNDITRLEVKQNPEGKTYIEGEVLVSEWINGVTWSIPRDTPIITLKSEDEVESYECWEMDLGQNNYYFNVYIDEIDISKGYEIEIESSSKKNISEKRKVKGIYSQNRKIGEFKGNNVTVENNVILFRNYNVYQGDLSNDITRLEVKQNAEGKTYIEGEVLVSEWIDGVTWSIPRTTPIIRLKSTDGAEVYECWEMDLGGNNYYFNVYIEGIDISKEYEIEIESGSSYNISEYRIVDGKYSGKQDLGSYQQYEVYIEGNAIKFRDDKYIGDLSNDITSLEIKQNAEGRTYIEGEVLVSEWLNGVTWSIPSKTPIIRLKSTDGTEVYECWEMDLGENNYYFNVYIEGIDTSKEYEIEIESGSEKNISSYRKVAGVYNQNKELGEYHGDKVEIENSKIRFSESTYRGDLSSDITKLELKQNPEGKTYIEGEVLVSEWIDGVTWSIPRTTPIIRLKSTDGTESYECWEMDLGENNYYFNVYIEGIDTSKEYEIEIESGSSKNTSPYRKITGVYSQDKELGRYEDKVVKVESNLIKFELETNETDEEIMSTYIYDMEAIENNEDVTEENDEIIEEKKETDKIEKNDNNTEIEDKENNNKETEGEFQNEEATNTFTLTIEE